MKRLPLSFRKRLAKRFGVKVTDIPRTFVRLEQRAHAFLRMHGASLDVDSLRTETEATLCAARRVCS